MEPTSSIDVFGCVGIAMLSFALFMSALMGIYQETVYARHGKHPSEALFYNVIKSTLVLHHLPLLFHKSN